MTTTDAPDADFEALLRYLREHRAADFTGYKRASLMRLVARRMSAAGVEGYRAYQDRLEVDPGEFALLFDSLLINVTSFLRDPEAWQAMRERILPTLLAGLPDGAPVRAWSAGCASGEEAYTLALLLADIMGPEAYRQQVKVYATDIDDGALAIARAGRFRREALVDVPADLVALGFEGDGDIVTVDPAIRAAVIFGRHDMIRDAPISKISVLTCRNALMYFNQDTQTRVLDSFAFALGDGGVLMVGKAEMISRSPLFVPHDLANRIFSRSGVRPGRRGQLRHDRPPAPPDSSRVVQAALITAPEPQLVLDPDGVVTLVNESAVRKLGVAPSDVGRPVRDLEISYRPVELRSLIDRAVADRTGVELKGVPAVVGGQEVAFDVQVVPLADGGPELLGVRVTFVDVTDRWRLVTELESAQRELGTAYEELQNASEELETTNEELHSAIEELETTNEELQSTNEELETMNEELQSTNEELQTLNDELRERTTQVNQVNSFLESILTGIRSGVVVVDRDLVVEVWNQRSERMWGLREHEAVGRSFLGLDIGLPVDALRSALRSVLSGEKGSVDVDVPAVNRFGRTVRCAITCSPLRDHTAKVTGVIVLLEETDT